MPGPFHSDLWGSRFPSALDCFLGASLSLDHAALGNFLGVLWEVWNSRKRFVFGSPDLSPERLASRAIAFIQSFRDTKLHPRTSTQAQQTTWKPQEAGCWKLNFDVGKLGDWGRGLGFVIRDSVGDVVMAGSKQDSGFHGLDVAEAEACLFSIQQALFAGYTNIIIKGDCLTVVSKLRNKTQLDSVLGFTFQKY